MLDDVNVGWIVNYPEGKYAWDDVHNTELPLKDVQEARSEEMEHMKGNTFKVVKKEECYARTGLKRPPSG